MRVAILNISMRFCSFFLISGITVASAASLPSAQLKRKPAVVATIGTVTRTDNNTGRIVRSVVIEPRQIAPRVIESFSTVELKPVSQTVIGDLVDKASSEHGVDPLLVAAIIHVESGFNPNALSPKGAEGLMQLMPETGRRWGAHNAFNPEENIRAGVRYFKYLQDMFKDDRLALAAYNAGENAVQRYGWIPPYQETVEYVYRVGRKYGENRRAASVLAKTMPLKAKVEVATAYSTSAESPQKEVLPSYRPVEYYVDSEGKLFLKTR